MYLTAFKHALVVSVWVLLWLVCITNSRYTSCTFPRENSLQLAEHVIAVSLSL